MIASGPKLGAAALVLLSTTYLVISLATGRTARSEPPPDLRLRATDAGLDVWRAAALALSPEGAVFVDVRPREDFARYHIPGAKNLPNGDAAQVRAAAGGSSPVILVAPRNDAAERLVGQLKTDDETGHYYFLQEGVRPWYLTFDLPVPVFSETPVPRGYDQAVASVKAYLAGTSTIPRTQAREALDTLVKLAYQPTLLKQGGARGGAPAPRKKISGGCGG